MSIFSQVISGRGSLALCHSCHQILRGNRHMSRRHQSLLHCFRPRYIRICPDSGVCAISNIPCHAMLLQTQSTLKNFQLPHDLFLRLPIVGNHSLLLFTAPIYHLLSSALFAIDDFPFIYIFPRTRAPGMVSKIRLPASKFPCLQLFASRNELIIRH